MPEIPSCLNRRYKALDNLIRELDSSSQQSTTEPSGDASQVGIKLMCDFWNILKDDPECNLTQTVQQCLGISSPRTGSNDNIFGTQRYMTYRSCCDDEKGKDKKPTSIRLSPTRGSAPPSSCSAQDMPLTKVLCNLQEAASCDKKCTARVKELMKVQDELKNQIQVLEEREKQGVALLKEADDMWLSMEATYKKKVSESLDRQKELLKQIKEVEESANKWRKNEKDLEFQIKNIQKARRDINETKNQKLNDIKIMNVEIANFQKRIESNKKDLENTKKSLVSKREASDAKLSDIAAAIGRVQKRTKQEIDHRKAKEEEGARYVRDAREDLQKICKVLLQKKIEQEDLKAERAALIEELELLNVTADNCKEKCKNKENSLKEELKKLSTEIATYKVKCIKCHVCTDTNDVRTMCTDCPKCLEERECKYGADSCTVDSSYDCVCMGVKHKFLDNIFDNMYTVLERKAKTIPGKAVADAVLNCLRKSTNGKLNAETRKILQDFVLTTVKKNLNLTIVGGAVKTRCELDPETYKQLMTCLNRIEQPKAIKEDKQTNKKDPCPRWSRSIECNCPRGPKDCVCRKKAPPAPNDPAPDPPQDVEDQGETVTCPHIGGVCGPDCGMQGMPAPCADADEIAKWRPDPCSGPSCSYSRNTNATQYLIGSETREPVPASVTHLGKPITQRKPSYTHDAGKPTVKTSAPNIQGKPTTKLSSSQIPSKKSVKAAAKHSATRGHDKPTKDAMGSCSCSGTTKKPCPCCRDAKHLKAIVGKSRNKSTQYWDTPMNGTGCRLPYFNKKSRAAKVIQSGVSTECQTHSQIYCNNKCDCGTVLFTTPSQEMVSGQFIITLENSMSPKYHFTALAKTKSGKLVMDLEEPLFQLIEKTANNNTHLNVSLKKTNSGHLIVGLDTEKHVVTNVQGVTIKKTSSGTNLLVMPKNLINIIQDAEQKIPQIYMKNNDSKSNDKIKENNPCPHCSHTSCKKQCSLEKKGQNKLIVNSKQVVNNKISSTSPITIELRRKNEAKSANLGASFIEPVYKEDFCGSVYETTSHIMDVYNDPTRLETSQSKDSQKATTSKGRVVGRSSAVGIEKELDDYTYELQHIYESGNAGITLLVEAKNLVIHRFQTVIFKSPSGTIGANLNMHKSHQSLKHISSDATYPVCLSKTKSGEYLVNINHDSQIYNAVLKKSLSGNLTLVPITPEIRDDDKSQSNTDSASEKFYKIKVAGYKERPIELPGVLKLTSSDNFIIILDKEFEKRYKETVSQYVDEQRKCFVFLEKTLSGYTIHLNRNGAIPPEELNALLVKSRSGHIKVLVRGDVFECIDTLISQRSSMSSVQIFGDLLGTLHPLSSREIHREKLRKSKFVNQKASSDTQLYKKVGVKFQVDKDLFTEPSAILKRTESGQYAVILNKESKKSFINNLRSYLASNPKGLVPIKRTDSGQIQIILSSEFQGKSNYGSLKITSSGNIYVIVNEETLQKMSEKNEKDFKPSSAINIKSSNFVGVDKAVTTTCNAKPEDCDCNSSKCVCAELQFEIIDWLDPNNVIKQDSTGRLQEPVCWMKPRHDSDEKCSEGCSTIINRVTTTQKDTSPYIVIKPAAESQPFKRSKGSTDQCFYVLDTVCPIHKDRYNDVSNELLEISGLCSKSQKQLKNKVEFTSNNSHLKVPELWDSLSYLPPQLPPFLNNVSYR